MNGTLLRALVALLPAIMLLLGAVALFSRRKTAFSFLQLFGAGCLAVVVLAHLCEGLRLFPWMRWGFERSAGHYLDLSAAVAGIMLFPVGYLLDALAGRNL